MKNNSIKTIAITLAALNAFTFSSCNTKRTEKVNLIPDNEIIINTEEEVIETPEILQEDNQSIITFEEKKDNIIEEQDIIEDTIDYVDNETETNYVEENNNIVINYGYLLYDIKGYNNKELNDVKDDLNAYSLVLIYESNDFCSRVFSVDKQDYFYVLTKEISLLNNRFIDIDLGEQRMDCYIDGNFESFDTRSGKDSTPTHTGAFDIDWMAENFEFTTYRGSYADHWIPYNDLGEGIHDLVGDDEQNYGNEAYHDYGSHGCVRVPKSASKYVYDNYKVGDMVLVHK